MATKLIVIIIGLLLFSCNKEEVCMNSTFPMSQLFVELSNDSDWEERVSYDAQIHEYSFKLDDDGQICSIGYQSQSQSDKYVIEIENHLGELIFQETLSFESTQTEYVETPNLYVVKDQEYKIRRVAIDSSHVIGRIMWPIISTPNVFNDSLFLPLKIDNMTITHVKFYGQGIVPGERAIPFIDFGFQAN